MTDPQTPATDPLDVESGMTPEALAKYRRVTQTPATEALLARHVADPATGVHRLPDESLTYACTECCMDWPCDVVKLAKVAKDVLDYDEKERWGSPHDYLSGLIGYYR